MIITSKESSSYGLVLCTKEQSEAYLMHYRVGGEKKGVRRWQNESGSLTPAGYKHYAEMYGWGKKLKKAERLQKKADKVADKADKAAGKADDAYVKSYTANKKNERRTTERRQEKADRAKEQYEERREKADLLDAKSRIAQRKASDYADKLQRKEDKLLKYANEDGTLNDAGLKRYTAPIEGAPGDQRKMSLIGRLKFGKTFADRFDEQSKNDADKRVAEQKAEEEAYQSKRENVMRELDSIHNDVMSGFDDRSDGEKRKLGDRVLKTLGESDKLIRMDDVDARFRRGALQDWLINRVDEKSGSINAEYYHRGTNAAKAEEKLQATRTKRSEREAQIKKEIGYQGDSLANRGYRNTRRYAGEAERLKQALERDEVWKKLDKQWDRDYDDVLGGILKDIGFSDTPQNRSLLYAYGWWD